MRILKSKTLVIIGDSQTEVKEISKAEEIKGKLSFQHIEDKLMHSVLDNDKNTIEKGKLLNDSISYGTGSFNPDIMFENLTKSYSLAKQIYGESILRLLSGYDGGYLKKNLHIPEFRKEVKDNIFKKISQLKDEGLVGSDYSITEKGMELASLVLYFQEIDSILALGNIGQKFHEKPFIYGEKKGYSYFKKGNRYKDIDVKKSVRSAIRRKRREITVPDLKIFEKQSKGTLEIIYALDASGSMKGRKIDCCKRAGISLAYRAVANKDKVGIIVFGSDIKLAVEPTNDFTRLIKSITSIRASNETDIASIFHKAASLFHKDMTTKHLVLITDAMPTKGTSPETNAIEAASVAKNCGITISIIGINLDEKGSRFAEKLAEIGGGKVYVAKDAEDIGVIVLEDYYSVF